MSEPLRHIRYPSVDFPAPPRIELDVPESWRPIGSVVTNELRPRPDIAVAGPDVVDGVRPNLVVTTGRIAVDDGPAAFLERLVALERDALGDAPFDSRLFADAAPPHAVTRTLEKVGDVAVLRLTCHIHASVGPVGFLVSVRAAMSARSDVCRDVIDDMFASVRVSLGPAAGAGVSHV